MKSTSPIDLIRKYAKAHPEVFSKTKLDAMEEREEANDQINSLETLLRMLFSPRVKSPDGDIPVLLFNNHVQDANPYTMNLMTGKKFYRSPKVVITRRQTKQNTETGESVPNRNYLLATYTFSYPKEVTPPAEHEKKMFWSPLSRSQFVTLCELPKPLNDYLILGGESATPEERAQLLPSKQWVQEQFALLSALTGLQEPGDITIDQLVAYLKAAKDAEEAPVA